MAEPATIVPEDPEFWEMSDEEIFGESGIDEPGYVKNDIRDEHIPDLGGQMASADEAKAEIERGISGARRIYVKYGDEIFEGEGKSCVDPFFVMEVRGADTSGMRSIIRGPRVAQVLIHILRCRGPYLL